MALKIKAADLPTSSFIAMERINHDKEYLKGDTIELNTLDAAKLLRLKSVVAINAATTVRDAATAIELNDLTKAQLAAHATETHNLELDPALNKADMIAAINNAVAAKAS